MARVKLSAADKARAKRAGKSQKAFIELKAKYDGKRFEELMETLIEAKKTAGIKVGFLKGLGTYPTQDGKEGPNVVDVAWWNEFGARTKYATIPARPFLRPTIRKNRDKYRRLEARLLSGMLKGKIKTRQATAILGFTAQSDVQNEILNLKEPPNAPSTQKKKKGVDNPLIDTGRMRQSVSWKLVKRRKKRRRR